jgi:hypothetical protein
VVGIVKSELERILQEMIIVYFKSLSGHLPEGTEKTIKNCEDNQPPCRNLNLGPLICEA